MKDNDYLEKNIKDAIGVLIGIYFEIKSSKDDHLTQSYFLETKLPETQKRCQECDKACKNSKGICSYKTYVKMREGKTELTDCQYQDLTQKIGLEFKMNKIVIENIITISREIKECMESGVEKEYQKCLEHIYDALKVYSKTIFFNDILQMFQSLIFFQLDKTLPKEEHIVRLEQIAEYLVEPMKYQTYYLIYSYYRASHRNKEKVKQMLYLIHEIYPDDLYFKLLFLSEKMPMLEYYKYLTTLFVESFTRQEQFYIYNQIAYVAFNLDNYHEVVKNLMKCIKIATETKYKMTEKEIYLLYVQYSLTQYHLGNYKEAVKYYAKVYTDNPNLMVLNLILFIHSLEVTESYDEIKKYLNMYQENELDDKIVKTIYGYYCLKYFDGENTKKIQKYITEKLAPLLYQNSTFYEIIHQDLYFYCEKNKSYKPMFEFQKNVKV